jgi:hypothetical protein
MESIEPFPWGPPVAYLYTLKLDDLSRAWEYLRRNRDYRSEFVRARRDPKGSLRPRSWGLLRWEDPREDARSVEPAWLSVTNSEIVLVRGHTGKDDRAFDFWKIPGRKALFHQGDHLRLTARRGSEFLHRARWPEDLAQDDPTSISIEVGRAGFTVRTRAAQSFLRSLDREAFGAVPERPSTHAITHMQIFQALDGDAAGASHREIARRLFGLSAEFCWDGDSRWRARVRYLIRCGEKRRVYGYRRMVGFGGEEILSGALRTAARPGNGDQVGVAPREFEAAHRSCAVPTV